MQAPKARAASRRRAKIRGATRLASDETRVAAEGARSEPQASEDQS
jgi:hypothetical protein